MALSRLRCRGARGEGRFGAGGVRRRKGLVKIEGRGGANGGLGRCDGQAIDGEAGGDGELCALARGGLSEGAFIFVWAACTWYRSNRRRKDIR